MAIFSQLPPFGHLAITDTPLLRTPRYNGHSAITNTLLFTHTSLLRTLAITDTPLLRKHNSYGHPTITDNPLLPTLRYYGLLAIMETPLLRTVAKSPAKVTDI